jgi:hypothetical protein
MRPIEANAAFLPFHIAARSASLRAVRMSNAPHAAQISFTRRVSCSTSTCGPSSSTSSSPSHCGYPACTAASAAWRLRRSMISAAAGRMPAAMISLTAAPAWSTRLKAAINVSTVSGRFVMRSVIFVAMPRVPSEPTNTPHRS